MYYGPYVVAQGLKFCQRQILVAALDVDVGIGGKESVVACKRYQSSVVTRWSAAAELVDVWVTDNARVVGPNFTPS